MERQNTAVLLSCNACGLVRVCDDYTDAHERGKAHTSLSGHHAIKYSLIEAPERLEKKKRSRKTVKGGPGEDAA
jgi:hypothetical protein